MVHGLVEGDAPAEGEPAIAAFRPQAVAVYREEVHGSPRNAFSVTVTEVEPRGDLVRVHAGDLAADVTVQAAADLELVEGSRVTFTVKATEIRSTACDHRFVRGQPARRTRQTADESVLATSSTARSTRSALRHVSLPRSSADQPRSARASSRFG